jgi:hypothetical protein
MEAAIKQVNAWPLDQIHRLGLVAQGNLSKLRPHDYVDREAQRTCFFRRNAKPQ